MTAIVGTSADSVWATRVQDGSGVTSFGTKPPATSIPAARKRLIRAPPKNRTGSSTAIGVDHQTPRSGTVPETLTALEPATRWTPIAILPFLPTVRAFERARSAPV